METPPRILAFYPLPLIWGGERGTAWRPNVVGFRPVNSRLCSGWRMATGERAKSRKKVGRKAARNAGKQVDRRVFLVLGGLAAVGAGVSFWEYYRDRLRRGARTVHGALDPSPSAGSGAPDLGSEVFCDARGMAIARPEDAPVIVIPRASWTNQKPDLRQMALMNGVERITVHHTATEFTDREAWKPTALELDRIEEFHTRDRKWADIAYHFVVDPLGRVWQGRPLAYQGAHAQGKNEHNLGIVLMGNFEKQQPTAAQLTTLTSFLGFLRELYRVSPAGVYTHGELGKTSCPGKSLQAFMNRLRSGWSR